MRILITGGFGNVGRSAVAACLSAGHEVTVFDSPTALRHAGKGLAALMRRRWGDCRIVLGDIRNPADLDRAFHSPGSAPDSVIHLAALIPPVSERDEARTWSINAEGTEKLVRACLSLEKKPRFVLASSIAIYGDRLKDFWISRNDAMKPSDIYSRSKVHCEEYLRASGLEFVILRLSYVVWAKWFPFDPLLYAMPPSTRIEIVHTEDAGRAFAHAATRQGIGGSTFNIGGGAACRTSFRVYLDRIFLRFGLGTSSFLPDEAFARQDFHCGWYADSDESDAILEFRRKTLEDFYEEVEWDKRFIRPLVRFFAPIARAWLLGKSPLRKAERRARAIHSPASLAQPK